MLRAIKSVKFSLIMLVFQDKKVLILLFVLFLLRLPFISGGFGADADAWRLVLSGKTFSESLQYQPSRFPGFPIVELLYALIWLVKFPLVFPAVFNLLTSVISIIACVYFYLICRNIFSSVNIYIYLALAAFGLAPVFYINSVNAMDYMIALAFILSSYYYFLQERRILSAVLLAFAIGCRLSTIVLIVPFIYMFFQKNSFALGFRQASKYVLAALSTAAIIYAPLWTKYGSAFLTADSPTYPSITIVLGRASAGVWGWLGSATLLLAGIYAIHLIVLRRFHFKLIEIQQRTMIFALIAIILLALLFLILPMESGYLLPTVPFVLLLLLLIPNDVIKCAALLLIIFSPFLFHYSNGFTVQGAILLDHQKRSEEMKYLDRALGTIADIKKPSLLHCEAYLPKLELLSSMRNVHIPANIRLVYTIQQDSLRALSHAGFEQNFYLRGIREQIQKYRGYDIKAFGGEPLNAADEE